MFVKEAKQLKPGDTVYASHGGDFHKCTVTRISRNELTSRQAYKIEHTFLTADGKEKQATLTHPHVHIPEHVDANWKDVADSQHAAREKKHAGA